MKTFSFRIFMFFTCLFILSCQEEDPAPTVEEIFVQGNGVTDVDGNQYETIIINSQEWMAENLKVTKYSNGDAIPMVNSVQDWQGLSTGAWCYYDTNAQYNVPYGKLYNIYTVQDSRNICPTGWHVPSEGEWTQLINYLDPAANGGENENFAGGKMKQTGLQFWNTPNEGATNESGFSALGAGYRLNGNFFQHLKNFAVFLSSTPTDTNLVKYNINQVSPEIWKSYLTKDGAASIRCIKD